MPPVGWDDRTLANFSIALSANRAPGGVGRQNSRQFFNWRGLVLGTTLNGYAPESPRILWGPVWNRVFIKKTFCSLCGIGKRLYFGQLLEFLVKTRGGDKFHSKNSVTRKVIEVLSVKLSGGRLRLENIGISLWFYVLYFSRALKGANCE